MNQVLHGDCLELMKGILDKSIDMILCDLPYGTTACKWDTIIPFEPLWEQYKRIIKGNGAIVLTASQPFTSALVMSNPKMFKYEWIWEKTRATGFVQSKKMPLKAHESMLIFGFGIITYNPQITYGTPYKLSPKAGNSIRSGEKTYNHGGNVSFRGGYNNNGTRQPRTVLKISNSAHEVGLHPTQKPVALFEYLIKTYTNEGDVVLDNCAGSFTTAIAAENTKRNWICMEQLEEYCEIGRKRISDNRIRLGMLDNCDIIK